MTLQVFTAHFHYSGPHRLDITRKSARPDGMPFAPSWKILGPALEARKNLRHRAHWPTYVEQYTEEMRQSYVQNRAAWDKLLAMQRVVLVCYCVGSDCHRRLLAEILVKLGATYDGEISLEREA